jgi:ribosomal protein S12 methylthiotransferase accessory factor
VIDPAARRSVRGPDAVAPAAGRGADDRARWLSACPGRARGWRRLEAAAILPLAEREARRLGAVRPSDLSGLDSTDVPCWQVVRPQALDVSGNITVLNGKGWTHEEARLGAWMEFLERHWAERAELPSEICRPSELESAGRLFLPAAAMPLPLGTADPGDAPLAWVPATTFWGQEVMVPAHDVLCPFVPPPGAGNPPIWRSAGLAAGSHPTEAVFHGLLELVERDAVAVAELARVGTSVDLATSGSPWIARLVPQLRDAGIDLEVKQLSTVGGASAFLASLDDRRSGNPLRLVSGHAAHVDPYLALEAAVLEALQARAVIIAGAREDLDSYAELAAMSFSAARRELAWWLDPTPERVAAPAAPLPPPADLAAVVLELESRLRERSFQPLLVVELTPPDYPVPVVRVIVPTLSEISHSSYRLGRRISLRAEGAAG